MDELIGAFVQLLLVLAGRVVIRAISLGHWQAEPLRSEAGRIYGAAGAFSFVHEGRRVITHTGQLFAALAFLAVCFGVVVVVSA